MLQGKVVFLAHDFQFFELHQAPHGGKQVVLLRALHLGGRLCDSDVLLDGLVGLLHLPPFLVELEDLFGVQTAIARDKKHYPRGAVHVFIDLLTKNRSNGTLSMRTL